MSSSMPLYYAGVASDDDELEEMLKKDNKLEHGFSSTVDLQRILGVSYQQIPLSRVKKMTAAVITVVAIILFISLSFHSASQDASKPLAISQDTSDTASTSPTGKISTTKTVNLGTRPKSVGRERGVTESTFKATQNNSKISVKSSILSPTTRSTAKNIAHSTLSASHRNKSHANHANKPTKTESKDKTHRISPTSKHHQSEFVLAMNPSIPADLNLDCSSCAVVTNSADLRNSNAGSVIDSNECVIRLNAAPTSGYEADVGAKTTVRVVSQHHLGDLLHYVWHEPEEMRSLRYIITFGRKNALCQNCTFFKMFRKVSEEYLGDKFIRLTKPLEKHLKTGRKPIRMRRSEELDSVLLSTQFHALNTMRKVCNRMKVFGVEANHPCLSDHSYRKSYWQPNEYVTCDGSREEILKDIKRYRFEKDIYDKWQDQYNLEFLYP